MGLKFYTDVHIPKAVAVQARLRGIDVVRCQEVGLHDAPDEAHLEYATHEDRVVVTADVDFRVLHAKWLDEGKTHKGIIAIPQERKDDVGGIPEFVTFFFDAVEGGAAELEADIYNQIQYM